MEEWPRICQECRRAISPDETVIVRHGRPLHLDCSRPRVLSAEERTLLYIYCQDHQVGECFGCAAWLRLGELAQVGTSLYSCPRCRQDVTHSVRKHLYHCALVPEKVRYRAQLAREAAQRVLKEVHEASASVVLGIREFEA